jgi:hypothetical protein
MAVSRATADILSAMSATGSMYRLKELIQPPDYPVGAYGDWKRFTSMNGFPPPEDYRMLIREYGVGTFADWIALLEPFPSNATFMEEVEDVCGVIGRLRRQAPHEYPQWGIWPEPGGFLPWATTTTGDFIGWSTEGRPDTWTTIFWGARGHPSNHFPVTAVGFLVGLADRTLGDPNFDDARNNPFLMRGTPSFLPLDA